MIEWLQWTLCLYAATFVVTSARSMQLFRNSFRRLCFIVFKGTELHNSFVHVYKHGPVLENDRRDEEDVKEMGVGYDFISCRMCVGFWLSLLLLAVMDAPQWGAAYGLSYFLATQERQ